MPIFYFHFVDGDDRCDDQAGIEFASAEAAYMGAIDGARGMWAELLDARRNPRRCAFEIADQAGNFLFRVDFSELLDACEPPSAKLAKPAAPILVALHDTHSRVMIARQELSSTMNSVRASLDEAQAMLSQLSRFEARPGRD